jgi:hypothetical protein
VVKNTWKTSTIWVTWNESANMGSFFEDDVLPIFVDTYNAQNKVSKT